MGKKLEFKMDREIRAVTFLSANVAGLTRAKADILVKSGEARVNGIKIRSNAVLQEGDILTVFIPDELAKNRLGIKIVYEDDNIIVFDKPKRTAYDALPQLFGMPLFAVHRLDTNTTGVIIFAKTEHAMRELSQAFKDRRVDKEYEAVVCPSPQKDAEVSTLYTRLDHSKNYAAVSAKPLPGYKTMITEYRVEKRLGAAAVLRVIPHTGRTHQIRAHLCYLGYPIIGEHKYGGTNANTFDGAPDTQMLAAVKLVFRGLNGKLGYLNGKEFNADAAFDLDFLKADQMY